MAPRRQKVKSWCCSQKVCSSFASSCKDEPKIKFSANLDRNFINVQFGKQSALCMIDSGASISCISRHLLKQISPEANVHRSNIGAVLGVCGERHSVLGETILDLNIDGLILKQKFRVFETLHAKVILGLDFLRTNQVKTDFGKMEITIPAPRANKSSASRSNSYIGNITVQIFQDQNTPAVFASTTSEVIVPPHSEMTIPVIIPKLPDGSKALLEPTLTLSNKLSLAGGKTICTVQNSKGLYRFMNPTSLPVFLEPKSIIAKATFISNLAIHELKQTPSVNFTCSANTTAYSKDSFKKIVQDLGISLDTSDLNKIQKEQLYELLAQNRDIFAKDISELGETNLQYHTIHTKDEKPVSCPPYRQTPQMRRELDKKLDELLDADIIEESSSPYHAPVVLVKRVILMNTDFV